MADFERLGVCPEIIQAIEEEGWLLPTPVQDEAIPLILGGGDVCAAAETGSGKTGAFGLPCLQIVRETLQNKALTSLGSGGDNGCGALLVPQFTFDVNEKDLAVHVFQAGVEAKCDVDRWMGVMTTGAVLKGKYMFEIEVIFGIVRVGWAAPGPTFVVGMTDRSFGYGGTGKKSWNNKFEDYGGPFGVGDIIGCLIDREQETISFAKNGQFLGIAYPIPPKLNNVALKPAVCGKGFHVKLNASTQMVHAIEGFVPIGSISPNHTTAVLEGALSQPGRGKRKPLCLILEPTRDLAQQTYDCICHFGRHLESPAVRIGLFVGGGDERNQREALQQGVDIVVGTLQKVAMYVKRQDIDVSNLNFLVLDEADDLMKNDEHGDILRIKQRAVQANRGRRVQTLFFSATLHSPEVRSAIDKITSNPTWVDLKGKPSVPETVHLVCYKIDPRAESLPCQTPSALPPTDGVHANDRNPGNPEKFSQRIKIAKSRVAVAIADAFAMNSCMVFCRTNVDCDNFEKYLITLGGGRGFKGKAETGKENPYSCVVLAGMRSQDERHRHLEYFKAGDVRFLVCTDVAARGIDIKELPFLIMLTLPDDPNQFFHRVGRVGRADRIGLAISIMATEKEKVWYHKNCSNRGKGCTNTNLLDAGGCCIWYDEPECLSAIENTVGTKLPVMDAKNFAVKGIIDPPGTIEKTTSQDKVGRRSRVEPTSNEPSQQAGKMTMYGKSKDGAVDKVTQEHMSEVATCLEELSDLEKAVQRNYVELLYKGIKGITKYPA